MTIQVAQGRTQYFAVVIAIVIINYGGPRRMRYTRQIRSCSCRQ